MRRLSPLSPTLFVAGGCGRKQQYILILRHKTIFLDLMLVVGKACGFQSDSSVRLGLDPLVNAIVSFLFVALGR
jgi:hypothetical protein